MGHICSLLWCSAKENLSFSFLPHRLTRCSSLKKTICPPPYCKVQLLPPVCHTLPTACPVSHTFEARSPCRNTIPYHTPLIPHHLHYSIFVGTQAYPPEYDLLLFGISGKCGGNLHLSFGRRVCTDTPIKRMELTSFVSFDNIFFRQPNKWEMPLCRPKYFCNFVNISHILTLK